MPTAEATKQGYSNLWNEAQVKPERTAAAQRIANRIIERKQNYIAIQQATGVPWFFTGPVHYRESNLDFGTHLHNGDPLRARTVHVPAGRPIKGNPPFTFIESAEDALSMSPHALNKIRPEEWTLERLLYETERYNGFGYFGRGNSPYLWSFTTEYIQGKYVADGQYSSSAVDAQCGTVAILKELAALDPEVAQFTNRRQPKPPTTIITKAVQEGTKKERSTVTTGVAGTAAGTAGTVTPHNQPVVKHWVGPTVAVVGVVALVVGLVLLARKGQLIKDAIAQKWG